MSRFGAFLRCSCSKNHSRSWPEDSAPTDLGCSGSTGAWTAASTAASRPRGVGVARNARSDVPAAANRWRAAETMVIAVNESPPAVKKSSSGPIEATPRASATTARTSSSVAAAVSDVDTGTPAVVVPVSSAR